VAPIHPGCDVVGVLGLIDKFGAGAEYRCFRLRRFADALGLFFELYAHGHKSRFITPDGLIGSQLPLRTNASAHQSLPTLAYGSRYRSGRSPDWLKFKNPAAPAVRREAEEDWGRK
jgi:hypothetical protein